MTALSSPLKKSRCPKIVCHGFAEAVIFTGKRTRHGFCEAVAHLFQRAVSPSSSQPRRLPGAGWTCAAALLLAAALTWANAFGAADQRTRRTDPATSSSSSPPPRGAIRVREGTEIVDQSGHFRVSGGRVIFFTADGKRRLVGLENLTLERIARTIADTPQTLQWGVSGTITEYRGTNFLLVRRAILNSGVQYPAGSF